MPLPVAAIATALVDGLTLVNALAPLVARQANGETVTQAEVDATLEGLDADLDALEELIAQKRQK